MKAIIYTSNTSTTKKYAQMIGKRINIPVYNLHEAKEKVQKYAKTYFRILTF